MGNSQRKNSRGPYYLRPIWGTLAQQPQHNAKCLRREIALIAFWVPHSALRRTMTIQTAGRSWKGPQGLVMPGRFEVSQRRGAPRKESPPATWLVSSGAWSRAPASEEVLGSRSPREGLPAFPRTRVSPWGTCYLRRAWRSQRELRGPPPLTTRWQQSFVRAPAGGCVSSTL